MTTKFLFLKKKSVISLILVTSLRIGEIFKMKFVVLFFLLFSSILQGQELSLSIRFH